MNASKKARYVASIINRPNCGGPKKGGLAARATGFMITTSNPRQIRAVNMIIPLCVPNRTVQTQRVGYQATLG